MTQKVRKNGSHPSTDHFGKGLIDGREEGDGPPLLNLMSISPFRDEVDGSR